MKVNVLLGLFSVFEILINQETTLNISSSNSLAFPSSTADGELVSFLAFSDGCLLTTTPSVNISKFTPC